MFPAFCESGKQDVVDEREAGEPIDVSFRGELRPEQREAVGKLLPHDIGVLAATTAFGKTVAAAWMTAERGVNTLIVVHTKPLLEQWRERLSHFLGIPPKEIGVFGGGKKKPGGKVDVAIMQSLVRRGVVDDRVEVYGHVIFDECHHLSAPSFEAIARRVKARYVLGLSATVARKDGKHPIILMQCGPIRHRVDAKLQAKARPFLHTVLVHPTGFFPPELKGATPRDHFHELYKALIEDEARNEMIASHVVAAARQGRSPIVLTERTEHLESLERLLRSEVEHVIVLRGGLSAKRSGIFSRKRSLAPGASSWQSGNSSAKASTIPAWTACFLPCRSRGAELLPNTRGGCTASTATNTRW